jgi:hypothetical protein
MTGPSQRTLELRILGLLCIFILCGILVAGLWPFHAPINAVTWLTNANGLRFGDDGTVVTFEPFRTSGSADGAPCSLEIWLRPRLAEDSSTILAFFTPQHPVQFSLNQSMANLALQKESRNAHLPENDASLVFVDEVFRQRMLVLMAVSSGEQGTKIYVDGSLAKTAPQFRLSTKDFAGQLVLGTSPVVNDTWSGELRGLAIYQRELTAAQVSRHFATWTTNGRPDIGQNEGLLALYLFDELQGRVVHDRSGSGIDLTIPERYMILREKFLEPPWKEFHRHWGYWKNVLINIGGFIPLGFFFCAYLTLAKHVRRPALLTVIFGAATSLTIEVLQAYLPTRDSGMTDLMTNTLGAAIGVMLYRWKAPLFAQTLGALGNWLPGSRAPNLSC